MHNLLILVHRGSWLLLQLLQAVLHRTTHSGCMQVVMHLY